MMPSSGQQQRKVILAPYPRTLREILADEDLKRLRCFAELVWARDGEIPARILAEALTDAWAYVGTHVPLDPAALDRARVLRVIVETGGSFPTTVDYAQCFARGIRVLSCAPAFGRQVAEMGLALTLAVGRGVVDGHAAFGRCTEAWFGDPSHSAFDTEGANADLVTESFTLFGRRIGLIGFGSLARNLVTLLQPFGCRIMAFDPWLPQALMAEAGVEPADLDTVLEQSDVTYVLATPTQENRHLIDAAQLARMPAGALLVVLSRAHLVDFDALQGALEAGQIRAAIDVFPQEPLPRDHPLRKAPNTILSAHRAAALRAERQLIGQMLVDDLEMMNMDLPPARLQQAQPELVHRLDAAIQT